MEINSESVESFLALRRLALAILMSSINDIDVAQINEQERWVRFVLRGFDIKVTVIDEDNRVSNQA